jgi:hypothetical protein
VPPSTEQRRSLEEQLQRYEASRTKIQAYLAGRGLEGAAERFRLGFVEPDEDNPVRYWNRLVIPYLSPTGCLQLRYRCIADHDCKERQHGKYLSEAGVDVTLFNASAVLQGRSPVVLTEGEFDAIAVETIAGLPAVGIPGAQAWGKHPYWARCFVGHDLILPADGDDAGQSLADAVKADLPETKIVRLPDGDDCNSVLLRSREEFLDRLGLGQPGDRS